MMRSWSVLPWFQGRIQRMRSLLRSAVRRQAMPLMLVVLLVSTILGPFAQAGLGFAAPVYAQGNGSGTPNRFNPSTDTTSVSHPATQTGPTAGNPPPPGSFQRSGPPSMQPGLLPLQPGKAAHFLGSDGRLEVNVPSGAITSADMSAASGQVDLKITQIAPASGSNAGGSGHVSFGTYLLQVVDGTGKLVPHGLRQPVTLTYHYGPGSATDVAHAVVVFNSALPAGVSLAAAPTSPPAGTSASTLRLGAPQTKQTTLNSTQQTLSVNTTLTTAATSASFDTDAPVAIFGSPDPFNVNLNAGALTFGLPIDVPAGPGGLTPPLTLSYSSENVSEQHNPQGAAPWVGEGWNLTLGDISWAEHNVAAQSGGNTWESSWQLADLFGNSAELIPPNVNVSTYYDDTPNVYYNKSANSYPNEPIEWRTATNSPTRIYSYVGPNSLPNMPAKVSCFRVYLPNGIMEEFGCTPDSVEYYYVPSNLNSQYIAKWLLDLIIDPQGNQIHITYQNHSASLNGVSYTRDVEPQTVEWDAPSCHSVQSACVPSWQPLMRVNFVASHNIARLTNSPSGCNTGSLMRCDDPLDLSGSGGEVAPEVQNTFALNDLQVQVRSSSSASWNTLEDYQFSYEASGPATITDPVTGLSYSHAGMFDLTQLKVVGDDGSTTLPTRTFSYTAIAQHYEDAAFKAVPSSNCGWSWNTNCYLWDQSHSGNSRYMTSASNGQGLAQTFSWAEARNNTHGVNSGGSSTDPLYCDSHQSGYPCDLADDENWSHVVLTGQSNSVVRPSSSGNNTVTSTTSYSYLLSHLGAQPCSDCTVGYDWGDQNDLDYLDFYNGKFMGFTQVTVTNPDGSVEVHHYKATGGWGVYDASKVTCISNPPCHSAPWWSSSTALHGREYEADYYDTDGTTLLKQVKTQYQLTCPPSGVGGTPGFGPGQLRSMLDPDNPVVVCDIQTGQVDTYTFDGASSSLAVPHQTLAYTYDAHGNILTATVTTNDGGTTGSPTTIVQHNDYILNITFTANWNGVTGLHLVDFLADSYLSDAGNTVHTDCGFFSYDGQSFATGQQSTLTRGNVTTEDHYTSCGTSANSFATSGLIRVTSAYDQYGNPVATTDADGNAGNNSHVGCTIGSTQYSICFTYDSTFEAVPQSLTNALGQRVTTTSTNAAGGGFGLWPTTTTDANGQITTAAYDPMGRQTSTTLPGETSGLTTTTTSYTDWCTGTSAQTPCVEVDTTQRLDSGTTVTSRAFYDGWGDLVETRAPGPNGQDVVQYADYDPSGQVVFLSNKYFVSAYTGGPGASAFATPDASQAGTSYTYTNLRSTTVKDALSHTTTTTLSVVCGVVSSDSACYEASTIVDPLGHQSATYSDALGAETYSQTFTGNSPSTYAVYAATSTTYDLQGDVAKVTYPNGTSAATYTYDDTGRETGMSDPNRGTQSYSYDANGNLIELVDARGSAGTIFIGYDALDRQLWRNTSNSATGAYVTYSYDSTANGNLGGGHVTGETFTGGPNRSLSGSESFVYDGRDRLTSQTLTVGGTSYTTQTAYNDANQVTSLTYPDGEVVSQNYTNEGWLGGVTTQQKGVTTTLLSQAGYTGPGGAAGLMTSALLNACDCQYSASYDLLLRQTDNKLTRSSDNLLLFDQTRTFDAAGNVSSISTTLPQGTDTQAFCYDEQNRLTWAGSKGTPPCTGTAITPGTLTAAQYSESFTYDNLNRMTSGPLGTYTYGDPAHLDAVTGIGSSYTASYDAAGNMICRATTSSATCAGGASTGEQMSYDNEGQLIAWQNAPTNPTAQADYLYDGQGNRVEQQVTQQGATTTTVYVGNLEEIATSGTTTTTTVYYYANGQRIAMAVNGVISCMLSDTNGSTSIIVDAQGNAQTCQLYDPYGVPRYTCATLPTDYGYGGQHVDPTTMLNFDGGRYYDPATGQFTSPGSSGGGGTGNPYLRGGGNPENNEPGTGIPSGSRRTGAHHPGVVIVNEGAPQGPTPGAPSDGPTVVPPMIILADEVGADDIILIILFLISLLGPPPTPVLPPVPPGGSIVYPLPPGSPFPGQPTNPPGVPPALDPGAQGTTGGNKGGNRSQRRGNKGKGGGMIKKGRDPAAPVPPAGPSGPGPRKPGRGGGGSDKIGGGGVSGGGGVGGGVSGSGGSGGSGGGSCVNTGVGDTGCFDSGNFDSGWFDSGSFDSGSHDSGWFDSGSFDRGWYDSGNFDSGWYDSGSFDSGWFDSGNFDSGWYDSGSFDSGWYDSGNFDSGWYDSGSFDTGSYDSGNFDSGWFDSGSGSSCWFDWC